MPFGNAVHADRRVHGGTSGGLGRIVKGGSKVGNLNYYACEDASMA